MEDLKKTRTLNLSCTTLISSDCFLRILVNYVLFLFFDSLCNKNSLIDKNPLKPALNYLHLYLTGLKNGRTIQYQAKRLQSLYSFHICNTQFIRDYKPLVYFPRDV